MDHLLLPSWVPKQAGGSEVEQPRCKTARTGDACVTGYGLISGTTTLAPGAVHSDVLSRIHLLRQKDEDIFEKFCQLDFTEIGRLDPEVGAVAQGQGGLAGGQWQ